MIAAGGRRWPEWTAPAGAIAAYACVTGLLIWLGLSHTGGVFVYAQDDPYIHLTIARNLAEHGVWGIRPTEFASASSSPLWTVLLASLWAIGVRGIWVPLALNAIAAVALLAFVDVCLRPILAAPKRFVALVALIFITPLPTLAVIGMEHTLQVLLVIALVWTTIQSLPGLERSALMKMCLLAMALAATRYEGLLVVAAICLLLAWHRRLDAAVVLGLAALVPVAIFAAYSTAHGALPLPNSVLMKSGPSRFSTLGSSVTAIASDWFAVLSIFGRPPELALTCAILLALTLTWRACGEDSARARNLGVLFVLAMTLHVCLVKLEWFFRYEAYLMAIGTVCVILFAADRSSRELIRAPFARVPPGTALVVLLSLPIAVRALSALATTPGATRNVYEQQYQMGMFFRDAYPAEPIAVNDIGAVGWLSSSPILDIVGLATNDVADLKRHGRLDADALRGLVAAHDARVVAMYKKVFDPIIPRQWTLVGEWTIHRNVAVSEDTVGFYAPRPEDAPRLRTALDEFARRLPPGVRYTPRE
jgi:hypothetical protein